MDELKGRVRHLRQLGLLNKIDDSVQRGINKLLIIPHGANAQDGLLPEILIFHLSNRYVKPLPGSLDERFQDLPFSFEGYIFMDQKLQLTDPDDHPEHSTRPLLEGGRGLLDRERFDDIIRHNILEIGQGDSTFVT